MATRSLPNNVVVFRKTKKEKPKSTALDWIRDGFTFPGAGVPWPVPPRPRPDDPKPEPLPPIQTPPTPDNPPKKEGAL